MPFPKLSLGGLGLPILASEAAMDIDNYMNGLSQEDESVRFLAHSLENMTKGDYPPALSLGNRSVLAYAISGREKFEEYWKGKPPDEVVLQIQMVAKDLGDFKSLTEEKQNSLVNFCLNLTREAVHFQSAYP